MNDNTLQTQPIPSSEIRGKTLDVYYYLASIMKPVGVREVQRHFGYSSPSVAAYHLNRLLEASLVKKTPAGEYFIEGRPERIGVLKDHIMIAGKLIPRIILYGYHALLSIFIGLLFFALDLETIYWFSYLMVSSIAFLSILIRDAFIISKAISETNTE